jgi:hypothetical protein
LKAQHHCHLKETIVPTKTLVVEVQTLGKQRVSLLEKLTVHNQNFESL